MADTKEFKLLSVKMTPPYQIKLEGPTPGQITTHDWENIDTFRAWWENTEDFNDVDVNEFLKAMLNDLRKVDPDLSTLPTFVDHTIRITGWDVTDLGVI
jgi:hypothetical protein